MSDLLERYLDELYRWNRRMNLTTVPREEAWPRHVGESLRLLDAAAAAEGASMLDIGTGGGVPGLVIAIVRPDLQVTLLEADRRKAGFLTHTAGVCGCNNVTVVATRAEEVGRDVAYREKYDLVVSRAAAPVPVLCELALPLLRVGGRLVALVGDAEGDSGRAAFAASLCGGDVPVAIANDILAVTKVSVTVDSYPRRVGVPTRKPLL
jgi:16S rRNA (guanine527-N7)-methyltransferase